MESYKGRGVATPVSPFKVQENLIRIYGDMMSRKLDKPSAYAWVAYMVTHQPKEMARVRKYGTPSDELIKIAEQPVAMTTSNGKFKMITFPLSLSRRAGQDALAKVLAEVDTYLKSIPIQAHSLFQDMKSSLKVRRADAKDNILMVAEAILHRASSEFKHEVLFAFDSINTWIKAKYNKELGYLTIRKALEVLVDQHFIKVNEWGKRGNRSKCTKIEFLPREYILTYTSDLDEWLLYSDFAMTAVYRRESTTRQDVLESRFHHFADQVAAEMMENSRWAQGARLFPSTDDRMAVVEVTPVGVIIEEGLNETYIDRYLGRMVPALQETVPITGQTSAGILRSD
jgi:hypothetical protein